MKLFEVSDLTKPDTLLGVRFAIPTIDKVNKYIIDDYLIGSKEEPGKPLFVAKNLDTGETHHIPHTLMVVIHEYCDIIQEETNENKAN